MEIRPDNPLEGENLSAAVRLTKIAAAAFPRCRRGTRKSSKGRPAKPRQGRSMTADARDALVRLLLGPLWGMAWRLAGPDRDGATSMKQGRRRCAIVPKPMAA